MVERQPVEQQASVLDCNYFQFLWWLHIAVLAICVYVCAGLLLVLLCLTHW